MSQPADLEQKLAVAEQTIAELRKENSQIQELEQLKNTFVSTASHQLRTPLTQLKWVLSIFQDDPEIQKMPNQVQLIKQAFAGVDRIIDTVNDFVNVSRIQHGALPYSPQEVDPNKGLNDVVKRNQEVATSRSLKLELTTENLPTSCMLDPILFQEAVENLVNNALDYAKSETTVTVAAKVAEKTLSVRVSNVGIGVAKDEENKVARPFFRGQQAIMAHPDGSGLGLYLVKAIAEAHKGSFELVNGKPEETVFELKLPLG